MKKAPFIKLESPRRPGPKWLPPVLRDFYRTHEGIAGSTIDSSVRVLALTSVRRVKVKDIISFAREPEWREFSGIEIGVSSFGDQIIYVLNAPCAQRGTIMAFGMDVFGPGGTGDCASEGSIVLAADFSSWVERLRKDDWEDYGLVPGGIRSLPAIHRRELANLFQRLNPEADWSRVGL